ncbi:hypothetical protein ACQEDT_23390 [Agrobacterium pusense]
MREKSKHDLLRMAQAHAERLETANNKRSIVGRDTDAHLDDQRTDRLDPEGIPDSDRTHQHIGMARYELGQHLGDDIGTMVEWLELDGIAQVLSDAWEDRHHHPTMTLWDPQNPPSNNKIGPLYSLRLLDSGEK